MNGNPECAIGGRALDIEKTLKGLGKYAKNTSLIPFVVAIAYVAVRWWYFGDWPRRHDIDRWPETVPIVVILLASPVNGLRLLYSRRIEKRNTIAYRQELLDLRRDVDKAVAGVQKIREAVSQRKMTPEAGRTLEITYAGAFKSTVERRQAFIQSQMIKLPAPKPKSSNVSSG